MQDAPVTAVEQQPDLVLIRVLVERLAEDELRSLAGEVRGAAESNPGLPVVLDMARVNFVPSLSLAALIRIHTEFRGRDQRLLLAAMQPQVRDVFVMTRLDRLFEMHESVEAATRSLRPG
jgi:anti-sigma B factor antagonist